MKKIKKWLVLTAVAVSFFSFSLISLQAYALIPDAAVVAILTKIWSWAKGKMMNKMQAFQKTQTNKITNKAENIFKQKVNWEKWPASLREKFVEQAVKYEMQSNQMSYNNAQSYLDYTQGSASGADAAKNPAQATASFNRWYKKVQDMSPSCQVDVPQPIGDTDNKCSPAQNQYTNYLLANMHPVPNFPKSATRTAIGEEYIKEKRVHGARSTLAQLALDQATNSKTNNFIKYMQESLQNPTTDKINQESSAAVLRDTLIINKARAIIELKQYEATLMNERLLATLVAQGEGAHMKRIRELSQNIN